MFGFFVLILHFFSLLPVRIEFSVLTTAYFVRYTSSFCKAELFFVTEKFSNSSAEFFVETCPSRCYTRAGRIFFP